MADFTDRLYRNALRTVRDKGTVVVFTLSAGSAESYDETSEEPPPSSDTVVPGQAAEVPGDPEEYASLELIASQPITLIFVPDVLGQLPALGSTATWAGKLRTVHSLTAFRPAGVAVGARLVLT